MPIEKNIIAGGRSPRPYQRDIPRHPQAYVQADVDEKLDIPDSVESVPTTNLDLGPAEEGTSEG